MKKIVLVVVGALSMISLAACGSGTSKKNPEKSQKIEQKQKNKFSTEQSSQKPIPRKQPPKLQLPKTQESNKGQEKGEESKSKESHEKKSP
ncbi:hypothetical protein [Enterococcus sp.]|uniref:hypothetical protein n=1 Tax=Enterococcus sp. TaxID=35783 RepID=UPI0025BB8FC2|nr:hypothetical protein [Enterococcus sp.]